MFKLWCECHLRFECSQLILFIFLLRSLQIRLSQNELELIIRMILSSEIKGLNYGAPLLGLAKPLYYLFNTLKTFFQSNISLRRALWHILRAKMENLES